MKIYTKIVYDKDNNIIEEHSYDYSGPVAHAKKSQERVNKLKLEDRKKNVFERAVIDNENIQKYNKKKNEIWGTTGYSKYNYRPGYHGGSVYSRNPDDVIVSTVSETETPTEPRGKIENPLHKFATYNALFTLSGISEDELMSHSFLTDPVHDIIARSGGIGDPNVGGYRGQDDIDVTNVPPSVRSQRQRESWMNRLGPAIAILEQGRDIFFENVDILSTASPNPERGLANFTRMEFELHEPYNVTFVEKVRAATALNKYKDYMDAPLLLTIEWKGFDERGRDVTADHPRETLVRKIPILIVRVEFDVNEGGAQYRCIAVPYTDLGHDDRFKFPRTQIPTESNSAEFWCRQVTTLLDNQMIQEIEDGSREYKDKYIFAISGKVKQGGKKYKDGKYKESSTNASGQVAVFQSSNSGTEPDDKIKMHIASEKGNIDSSVSLTKYFEDILRNSYGYQSIIEDFWETYISAATGIDKKTLTENDSEKTREILKDTNQMVTLFQKSPYIDWFKIKTSVATKTDGRLDKFTKMHPKIITYYAHPYKIHIGKLIEAGLGFSEDFSESTIKDYNYIYTGENIDIQNLRILYKSAWYMRSLRGGTDAEADGGVWGYVKKAWKKVRASEKEPGTQLLSVRSYPSTLKTITSVDTQDPSKVRAQEFYDYLTNPEADMMKIEMEILGDPTFVAQDVFMPIHKDTIVNTLPGFSGPFNYTYQSWNIDNATPSFNLTYRLPEDIDDRKGIMHNFNSKSATQNLFFSGVYEVVKIDSNFSQGQFKQVLTCVRLHGQNTDGLTAKISNAVIDSVKQIESKKSENIESKTEKNNKKAAETHLEILEDIETNGDLAPRITDELKKDALLGKDPYPGLYKDK